MMVTIKINQVIVSTKLLIDNIKVVTANKLKQVQRQPNIPKVETVNIKVVNFITKVVTANKPNQLHHQQIIPNWLYFKLIVNKFNQVQKFKEYQLVKFNKVIDQTKLGIKVIKVIKTNLDRIKVIQIGITIPQAITKFITFIFKYLNFFI